MAAHSARFYGLSCPIFAVAFVCAVGVLVIAGDDAQSVGSVSDVSEHGPVLPDGATAAKEAQLQQRPGGNDNSASGPYMKVYAQNACTKPIYVAINYIPVNAPDFKPSRFKGEGWWTIQPGKTVHIANTKNSYVTFYAEEKDFEGLWDGRYCFDVTSNGKKRKVCGSLKYIGLLSLTKSFTNRFTC